MSEGEERKYRCVNCPRVEAETSVDDRIFSTESDEKAWFCPWCGDRVIREIEMNGSVCCVCEKQDKEMTEAGICLGCVVEALGKILGDLENP